MPPRQPRTRQMGEAARQTVSAELVEHLGRDDLPVDREGVEPVPIGDRLPNNGFKGVAIDPSDPPAFESQASYLKRHGIFLAGEERRLKKADFEAEIITE